MSAGPGNYVTVHTPAGRASDKHPTWSIVKSPVCYLKAASRQLTFGFWKGACRSPTRQAGWRPAVR